MRSASINESFKNAQKTLLRLRKDVSDLENSSDPAAIDGKEGEIESELEQMGQTLAALLKAIPQVDQEIWKRKIANAQNELRMISASLRDICKKRDRAREDEEAKRSLLDRRYNMDNVVLDGEYKINTSASNSVNMVSQYIDMGKNLVADFRRQREILDGVQSRLIDAGQTMGLSNSVMDVIRRRDFVDKLIVYGGMFVIVVIVVVIWMYRR